MSGVAKSWPERARHVGASEEKTARRGHLRAGASSSCSSAKKRGCPPMTNRGRQNSYPAINAWRTPAAMKPKRQQMRHLLRTHST